jgi:lipid II:glycine glycyltransferase (peptidoglycan interpeptide bridge formation enzyme)
MWQHLHKSLTLKNESPIAHLMVANHEGHTLVSWIVFSYDGFLYYPYGASTHKYKNVMASNLMMWEAIKFGKSLGCHTFDLWGREEGKGFTKFKEGYNPKVVEFLGTWDLVLNKKLYLAYRGAERLRWMYLKLRAQLGFNKYRF